MLEGTIKKSYTAEKSDIQTVKSFVDLNGIGISMKENSYDILVLKG